MRRATQGLLLAFLGAVLLRLALTDAYLRYVTTWMKWPIVASGVLLLLLALGPVLELRDGGDDHDDHDDEAGADADDHHDHVPHATWLLLLPGLVAFMIAPPALGSYLAERRSEESVVVAAPSDGLPPLPSGDQVDLEPTEFLIRAQEGGDTLTGRVVSMTGFVSYDDAGGWYVSRMSIACCAADATSYRVKVEGGQKPPRDQWVTVTGTHVDGTGVLDDGGTPTSTATITATDVAQTTAPADTYS